MEKSGVKFLAASFSVPVSAMVFLCLSSRVGIKTRSSFSFHRRLCAQNPSKYLLVVVEYLAALRKRYQRMEGFFNVQAAPDGNPIDSELIGVFCSSNPFKI